MKTRSIIAILGIAFALIAMFAAPPPTQAYVTCGSSSNIEFTYDGADLAGDWRFNWKTPYYQNSFSLQVNGGGVFNVWTTVNINLSAEDPNLTIIVISPISYVAGNALDFRVKVKCGNVVTITAETSVS